MFRAEFGDNGSTKSSIEDTESSFEDLVRQKGDISSFLQSASEVTTGVRCVWMDAALCSILKCYCCSGSAPV